MSESNPNSLRDEAIKLGKNAKTRENFAAADDKFLKAGVGDLVREYRELSATNIFRACLQARHGLNDSDYHPDARLLNLGIDSFNELYRDDQYRVNTIGRVSVLETLHGSKLKGFTRAIGAIAGSVFSESPWRPHSNQDLSLKDRFRAKSKALARGIGALTVSVLSLGGSKTHSTTNKLADKVLF
jgi:hypothetical protein